ncbi:hypothetical protein ASC89_24175 [Devosia sp. Root413D1]|nr:hypothetical protein ASC89_24175 [Devosia sp. Root413D1]
MREIISVVTRPSLADAPLPSSPMKGEVPAGGRRTIEPQSQLFTSPFMGEAGRGPSLSVRATAPRIEGEL